MGVRDLSRETRELAERAGSLRNGSAEPCGIYDRMGERLGYEPPAGAAIGHGRNQLAHRLVAKSVRFHVFPEIGLWRA
jgi:hypothetical protein